MYQPHLDASSAQLVLGKAITIPGALVGEPGPPLNSSQVRALLHELYKMADRKPVPMSGTRYKKDITNTESVTHVYVKRANPLSLMPKFEGPFEIYSRPTRSTIEIKIGVNKKDDSPRLLTVHWSSCKPAYLREDAKAASRPDRGRKPSERPVKEPGLGTQPSASEADSLLTKTKQTLPESKQNSPEQTNAPIPQPVDISGKIQNRPQRVTRNPAPKYVFAIQGFEGPPSIKPFS